MKFILPLFFALFIFSGCNYTKLATEKYAYAQEVKPFDLLLVPGFPYDTLTGWNETMRNRVLWSVKLMEEGIAKKVMYSGTANYSPYIEGRIMALYAEQLGVPKDKIIIEEAAEHSVENLYYAHLYALEHDWKTIAIATDAIQSFRFKEFKKYSKLDFEMIPIVYDQIDLNTPKPKIDLQQAYVEGFISLKDRKPGYLLVHDSGGRHLPKGKKKKKEKK